MYEMLLKSRLAKRTLLLIAYYDNRTDLPACPCPLVYST